MMTIYEDINQVSMSSIDSIIGDFKSLNPIEGFFKKYFFFKADYTTRTIKETSELSVGFHAFDDLIKLFPFFITQALTLFSFLVLPLDLDFLDIILLLEEEDTHNFEVKSLSSEWSVLLVDDFPLVFIYRVASGNFQKIMICSLYVPIKSAEIYNPSWIIFDENSLENQNKFTNYFCNNFSDKLKEYLDLQEIEYVES